MGASHCSEAIGIEPHQTVCAIIGRLHSLAIYTAAWHNANQMLPCSHMSGSTYSMSMWGRPAPCNRVVSHLHASTSSHSTEPRGRLAQPCAASRTHDARSPSATASADSPVVASSFSEQAERSRDWEHKAVFQGIKRASRHVQEGDRPLGETQQGSGTQHTALCAPRPYSCCYFTLYPGLCEQGFGRQYSWPH